MMTPLGAVALLVVLTAAATAIGFLWGRNDAAERWYREGEAAGQDVGYRNGVAVGRAQVAAEYEAAISRIWPEDAEEASR